MKNVHFGAEMRLILGRIDFFSSFNFLKRYAVILNNEVRWIIYTPEKHEYT